MKEQWTQPEDLYLLNLICHYKPIGKHKSQHYTTIIEKLSEKFPSLTKGLTQQDVLSRLNKYYDITGLEEFNKQDESEIKEEELNGDEIVKKIEMDTTVKARDGDFEQKTGKVEKPEKTSDEDEKEIDNKAELSISKRVRGDHSKDEIKEEFTTQHIGVSTRKRSKTEEGTEQQDTNETTVDVKTKDDKVPVEEEKSPEESEISDTEIESKPVSKSIEAKPKQEPEPLAVESKTVSPPTAVPTPRRGRRSKANIREDLEAVAIVEPKSEKDEEADDEAVDDEVEEPEPEPVEPKKKGRGRPRKYVDEKEKEKEKEKEREETDIKPNFREPQFKGTPVFKEPETPITKARRGRKPKSEATPVSTPFKETNASDNEEIVDNERPKKRGRKPKKHVEIQKDVKSGKYADENDGNGSIGGSDNDEEQSIPIPAQRGRGRRKSILKQTPAPEELETPRRTRGLSNRQKSEEPSTESGKDTKENEDENTTAAMDDGEEEEEEQNGEEESHTLRSGRKLKTKKEGSAEPDRDVEETPATKTRRRSKSSVDENNASDDSIAPTPITRKSAKKSKVAGKVGIAALSSSSEGEQEEEGATVKRGRGRNKSVGDTKGSKKSGTEEPEYESDNDEGSMPPSKKRNLKLQASPKSTRRNLKHEIEQEAKKDDEKEIESPDKVIEPENGNNSETHSNDERESGVEVDEGGQEEDGEESNESQEGDEEEAEEEEEEEEENEEAIDAKTKQTKTPKKRGVSAVSTPSATPVPRKLRKTPQGSAVTKSKTKALVGGSFKTQTRDTPVTAGRGGRGRATPSSSVTSTPTIRRSARKK